VSTSPDRMSTVQPAHPAADFVIAAERCWSLLAATRIARVAFIDGDRPALIVLNHVPQGQEMLFSTSEESRLARLTSEGHSVRVTAEVDSSSASDRAGWSVVVAGLMTRTDEAAWDRLPTPWRPEAVGVLLRLSIEEISGRHVDGND
jgi:nitroimidazol reductase NimA-like FMN-containing flavoprotein (pyridoxamine 5'-phosphate oxidase superfamily)